MRKYTLHGAIAALASISVLSFASTRCLAAATISASPAPYLSTANSTLNPLSPTYFNEDFEDGALNIPGVSFTAVGGGVVNGLSVDADDGSINGSGALGKSFSSTTQASVNNLTFFFSQVAGQWPKQVGIVMTFGNTGSLGLTSYDTSLNPSASLTLGVINMSGSTNEAFMMTFTDNAGIGAIVLQTNQAITNFNYDHLQFDTAPVPEPASLVLIPLAAMTLGRRRRSK
jgi:hypothetical protein